MTVAGWAPRHDGPRVGGKVLDRDEVIEVRHPYDGRLVGTAGRATAADVRDAIAVAAAYRSPLTRYERYSALMRTRELITGRRAGWARLITMESGLSLADTGHEVDRACDVLLAAANQALVDDGQVFACDTSAHGRARKVFTTRAPLLGVICAITPFNHPLNQVVHKVAPAVATGNRIVVKPSEKTPLSALAFADTLYEAGVPVEMVQVVTGDPAEIGEVLVTDPRVDLVAFTGSSAVGRRIAGLAGYRRVVLELGGADPAIVLDDADLGEAASLVAAGAFRNSGQRCTAVKRVLVHAGVAAEFTRLLVAQANALVCGDPLDPGTDIGTVIDEAAARAVESAVSGAVAAGARMLCGGDRNGALYPPAVVDRVRPDLPLVSTETFGPVAPVSTVSGDDEAIRIANASRYALSASVFTRDLERAIRFVGELHAGTVNVGETPGYRVESTPFGGLKDSGLGHKEGVLEAMKNYTNVKTYSLPWRISP
ncbi:phosphonoacetaldehyde dehydrogenase [Amycolatopsis sp. YIM 10]|uniref:phosphonoacetaldehyde dehydrogenase n=1 Tax=Amycolatopsis sp. YIM 10 TaxID=2653857 RepID=UPI0012903873|nr:phosphonoacetaldehyde dehydrogenase [Amycolatopsis sp. YIM 10]QFU91057.1 NADP-dependent glyceraldehyde-3-phosphate dehydrogenase [Amycolatopsis sp. YIM 10]